MRDLNIAYGNSCMAKKWSNKTITFGELCGRLENTIRTTETVEEYQKMKRAEREAAKDKGGFVGGQLKGGRRKRENRKKYVLKGSVWRGILCRQPESDGHER